MPGAMAASMEAEAPSASTRLPRALVLSLVLHAVLAWSLSTGGYRETHVPNIPDTKVALLVSFRVADAVSTQDDPPKALAAAPVSEDRYFTSSEVDASAKPLEMKPLIIPERAYFERTKGKLKLRLHISKDGKVERVDILEASPAGVYERPAIEAATASTFTPARRYGIAVKSVKDIEVNIDPYDTIAMP